MCLTYSQLASAWSFTYPHRYDLVLRVHHWTNSCESVFFDSDVKSRKFLVCRFSTQAELQIYGELESAWNSLYGNRLSNVIANQVKNNAYPSHKSITDRFFWSHQSTWQLQMWIAREVLAELQIQMPVSWNGTSKWKSIWSESQRNLLKVQIQICWVLFCPPSGGQEIRAPPSWMTWLNWLNLTQTD